MKSIKGMALTAMNNLVEAAVRQNANSACLWALYQPKFPEQANKYKINQTKLDK